MARAVTAADIEHHVAERLKRARAARLIAEAVREREELDKLRAALPRAVCRDCEAVMFQYRPPIAYVLHKCRVCGTWNETTAT